MKKLITIFVLFLTLVQVALSQTQQIKMLDTDWKFQKAILKRRIK
jgi:beta-galactosidase